MTISQELAIELRRVGELQYSRFYYIENSLVGKKQAIPMLKLGKAISAFMIDELLEKLPNRLSIYKDTDGYRASIKKDFVAYDVNLAECLGKLLLHLKEGAHSFDTILRRYE